MARDMSVSERYFQESFRIGGLPRREAIRRAVIQVEIKNRGYWRIKTPDRVYHLQFASDNTHERNLRREYDHSHAWTISDLVDLTGSDRDYIFFLPNASSDCHLIRGAGFADVFPDRKEIRFYNGPNWYNLELNVKLLEQVKMAHQPDWKYVIELGPQK